MAIELPEHLRTGPMAEAAARALQDANSMAASSNSVPRISLLGREFRLVESGDTIAKFRDYLNVHILGVEPEAGRMIKTFYKGGYTQGSKEPPTCSSDDGISPAPWVTEKQNPTCQNCPKNAFGSATSPSGKATKACRDSKRVWLKIADGNMISPGIGQPPIEFKQPPFADRTLYGMNVTVASLKAFSDYGKMLSGLGQGPAVCVTQLLMLDGEFPMLDFKLLSWLDAATTPLALEQAEKRPWKIKYANAGLALAGPDGGGTRSSLPTSLPGLPAHLQKQAVEPQGTQTVMDAEVPPTPVDKMIDTKSIDDAVGNW